MMSFLRVTLLFTTLLCMALLTAPDNSAAAPINPHGLTYGEVYLRDCIKTSDACFTSRKLCSECVRNCREAAAYSTIGKDGNFFAEYCRSRGGAGFR